MDTQADTQSQAPPVRLTGGPLRTAVEETVRKHAGRQWAAEGVEDLADFACYPCAILSGGSYSVFAKFSEASNGWEQFEIELAGLRLLCERSA